MKQASLIAAISMAVLVFVDLLGLIFGATRFYGMGILFNFIQIAAKCGVGYFFLMLYKKQN